MIWRYYPCKFYTDFKIHTFSDFFKQAQNWLYLIRYIEQQTMLLVNERKGETYSMDRRMYRGNYMPGNRNASPYRSMRDDCFCGDRPKESCERILNDYDSGFERYPLGMCYVPWQRFENLYENEFKALDRGTLFKDLDLEFLGRSCK